MFFLSHGSAVLAGLGVLCEVPPFQLDKPHSVVLLWSRNWPIAQTSACQHTAITTDRYSCPGGIRTCNPSKRAATDPCLRPRGHWDRLPRYHTAYSFSTVKSNWLQFCSCFTISSAILLLLIAAN